jgi:hypothetical protein
LRATRASMKREPRGTVLKEAGAVLSNECRAFWMMKTGNGGESRLELPEVF